MTAGTICALALAAFAVAPQISAQSSASSAGKGIFSSLKVGQMVEYANDAWGSPIITTYDDADKKAFMRHKVKEIGHDYLALEFDDRDASGAVSEMRITAHHLALLAHVGKSARKSGSDADDPLNDKPTKPGTKPKKKN
jgi:hypothetical protein